LLRQVRTLFRAGAVGGRTDAELLRRFTAGRREGEVEGAGIAFAELVERHGPMVLHVCRSVLRDEHDALDAFQATFLVLVRRADALRTGMGTVGPWLHAVAVRTARGARRASARRRALEHKAAAPEAVDAPAGPDHDAAALLHDEIGRLPSGFREAVVLCGLEGLTHEHAAERLGWPLGTLQSRLARGRARLRDRLTRRGLDPALLSAGLAPENPIVPEILKAMTIRTAVGQVVRAGGAPTVVTLLAEEVTRAMFLTKLRAAASALAVISAVTVGGVSLATGGRTKGDNDPAKHAEAPTPQPPPYYASDDPPGGVLKGVALRKVRPGDGLLIEVLEALPGRPISGVRHVRPDGTISLGFYGDLYVAGLNRVQIKEKVIERLRQFLPDEVLGLIAHDDDGKDVRVSAKDSDRIFVDDDESLSETEGPGARQADLQKTIAKLTEAVEAFRRQSVPPGPAEDSPAPAGSPKMAPMKVVKPGDYLAIEVLEALPGRPVTGVRRVRPDGTISLGFYGDLDVAGLNRVQIKEKLVEHFRKFLDDEVLGLVRFDVATGRNVPAAPRDSDRVAVDDDPDVEQAREESRFVRLERKIDELAVTIQTLRNDARGAPRAPQRPLQPDQPRRSGPQHRRGPTAPTPSDERPLPDVIPETQRAPRLRKSPPPDPQGFNTDFPIPTRRGSRDSAVPATKVSPPVERVTFAGFSLPLFFVSWRRPRSSVGRVVDDLAAGPRAEGLPDLGPEPVADEAYRAVGERDVDPSGVGASGGEVALVEGGEDDAVAAFGVRGDGVRVQGGQEGPALEL
jgi:RNA polymerase sigma factor (sigma-70 family)